MNKDINIVEILKYTPKGTKLWSPLCGECEFRGILSPNSVFQIRVKYKEEESNTHQYLFFSSQGKYCNCSKAECLLFPSKDNRDWSTFKAPWKHKHFEPYQKVLVAVDYLKDESYVGKIWCADLYGHYDKLSDTHYLVGLSGMTNEEIIPYEGNEYKLGKPVK